MSPRPIECQKAGYEYSGGLSFKKGIYETSQKCSAGACSIKDVILSGGDVNDCKAKGYCSGRCPKCVAPSDGLKKGCYDFSIGSASDCIVVGGVWNVDFSVCGYPDLTSMTCEAPLNYVTCEGLNEGACSSQPFQAYTQCQWSTFEACGNAQDCGLGGQCTDFEYGNSKNDGVCVYTPVIAYQCSTGDSFTKNGDCIRTNIKTESDCTNIQMKWVQRAKSTTSCQGSTCTLPGLGKTLITSSSCPTCSGSSSDMYRWINV